MYVGVLLLIHADARPLPESLSPAGLELPAVILDQGVILTPDDGAAKITQDDLGNTYDRVGGVYSNYKP